MLSFGGQFFTETFSVPFRDDLSPLTFTWRQTAGPAVTLLNPKSPTPSFRAQFVSADTVLTFQFRMNDGLLDSAPDSVNVTVRNAGASLAGVVTANGRAVAGAEVRLFRNRLLFRSQPSATMTTDGAGFYAFSRVQPGSYWLRVFRRDFGPVLRPVQVAPTQDRRLDVSLR